MMNENDLEDLRIAKKCFILGCFGLPWLLIVNIFYFLPKLIKNQLCDEAKTFIVKLSYSINLKKLQLVNEVIAKHSSRITPLSLISKSNICKLASISISTLSGPLFGGGFLSGGLHAVTGPDHLAAILPSSIGQSGWRGMKLGAIWGLGHGFSAIILGITAFIVKGKVSSKFKFLHNLSTFAESAVGLSLIAIGLLGLKENIFDSNDQELLAIDRQRDSRAIFANGLLHGFSWDGAPSLAPALAMSTWESILGFLLSYCIGTTFAMSLAVGLLSEGSTRLGKVVKSPDLTKTLSIISSILAILIGAFWILKSTLIK